MGTQQLGLAPIFFREHRLTHSRGDSCKAGLVRERGWGTCTARTPTAGIASSGRAYGPAEDFGLSLGLGVRDLLKDLRWGCGWSGWHGSRICRDKRSPGRHDGSCITAWQ